ncbi:Protein BTN1 [Termitomyces sp. J132]|nr:Protein BTN1 [Termitomyces sp. J132]
MVVTHTIPYISTGVLSHSESDEIEFSPLVTTSDDSALRFPIQRTTCEEEDMSDGESEGLLQKSKLQAIQRKLLWKLGLSFFLFGVITNVLFVIVLSAAQDLLPPSTPKGIITFCNITPVLLVKFGWPYLLKGRIRYTQRLLACFSQPSLQVSENFVFKVTRQVDDFEQGLNELTFLQLSTTYTSPLVGGHSVMYFASGTGAAGLVGAMLWWELRNLGVRVGVGLSSVLPFIIPLTYFFLLPPSSAFPHSSPSSPYEDYTSSPLESTLTLDSDAKSYVEDLGIRNRSGVSLTLSDKWRIMKSSIVKYMLPACEISFSKLVPFLSSNEVQTNVDFIQFEYTINQGVAPTLIYPVPTPEEHPILSIFINSIRDYYPLWQLVYQIPVFFSRSSISFGIPPLPSRLLPLPAIIQCLLFVILTFESAVGIYNESASAASIVTVFLLITIEGICGGLAYVNVFYHINQERPNPLSMHDPERAAQEKEFKIGSIGFADSLGILFASLLAVPTELKLCKVQINRGKMFCKSL